VSEAVHKNTTASGSSTTSVFIYQKTQYYIPEEHNFNTPHCKNFKVYGEAKTIRSSYFSDKIFLHPITEMFCNLNNARVKLCKYTARADLILI